ncbi:hypothetical protein ACEZCY_14105 [Streptacidiphilus sp. N1-12]|uniref:Uncharacterized protein n=2 Tax=Streptacidiphilus alkalitolerans TaxID=3342712 RepID=A0ABV6V9K1_9ACTN
MSTTALAPAGIHSGQILGSLGASGAALAVTVILVLGVRARHRIKFNQHQAAFVGLVAGTLYATAVGIWSAPASLSGGLTDAVRSGIGGNVGAGAVAVCITAIIYGAKLKPGVAALLGICAATVYAAAGGIWGLASAALASALVQVLGAV